MLMNPDVISMFVTIAAIRKGVDHEVTASGCVTGKTRCRADCRRTSAAVTNVRPCPIEE